MEESKLNEFMEKAGIDILPKEWQKAIKRVYGSYPKRCLPTGVCDPVYICNVFAKALKLGDGRSNFKELI